ncbi:MAG: PQQ-binding-like beta-propeller repeat protein, partial [Gammaproteobacteria bacterium]|nr:PQQ-binding-like beta-propeller repeat protein [Gammaproteobacteria bacterium]
KTTFVSPTVSVNTFNKIETRNDLFIAMFEADNKPLWDGNLKKYQLIGGEIVGADGTTPVVDPNTGFFSDTAQNLWASSVDGSEVQLGGASALQPDPASRNLYVNVGGDTSVALTDTANQLLDGNASLTDAMLTLGAAGDPSRANLLAFSRGQDVLDSDDDGDTTDARQFMGDPLHAKPVSVVYGGSAASPDAADAVVYVATNEGFLHAINGKTGQELWAFMPRQLLPNLKNWYVNDSSTIKGYGLDGDVRARQVDLNGNGVIEPAAGDKVILYFGMRRGGNRYFALDVSDRNAPELLWSKDSSDFPGLGQTWSMPMVTRVDIQGATQNSDQAVLVFGGGYDTGQDSVAYSTDSVGNGIYMVDADSGNLLWRVGPDAGAQLQKNKMQNAIPAAVRVLDMNSDGFADRMYAGDLGGRLWRFDIFNGQPATDLVKGGVIASLGAADMGSPTVAASRRFYNTPDVSLVRRESASYLAISIGSGYRAHPLDQQVADSFYSIRDYSPFRQLNGPEYSTLEGNMVTHDDARLADIAGSAGGPPPTVPAGAMGWRLDMPTGEKVLAQSRTFQEKVFFTSYSPNTSGTANACVPQRGSNKLYIVGVEDGKPPYNLDGVGSDTDLTIEDRAQQLKQTGIAPDVAFLFQADPDPAPGGVNQQPGGCGNASGVRPRCLIGLESCPADFCNAPVRTFWTQDDATEDQ